MVIHGPRSTVGCVAAACMKSPGSGGASDFVNLPAFDVSSTAFAEGSAIPSIYTCDGAGQSIPLTFAGLPADATHATVIFDDPDAPSGTWTHGVFWDLPVSEGAVASDSDVSELGATIGANSWGRNDNRGPCPPDGEHRYIVHAFANSGILGPSAGAGVDDVWLALRESAIASAELGGGATNDRTLQHHRGGMVPHACRGLRTRHVLDCPCERIGEF
jgi:Raf kinase inhibitor-like YbhB/YbcL family protein